MTDAITLSIDDFSYKISDLININKDAFTNTTYLRKLNNTLSMSECSSKVLFEMLRFIGYFG